MLYGMVMLPMTLGDPNPLNYPNFCIFVAFHIFVVGEHRDFSFGTQVIIASPSIWMTNHP